MHSPGENAIPVNAPADPISVNPGPPPLTRMVNLLNEQRPRIIANWLLRVTTLPAFRAMPGLALTDLQQRIPEILDETLSAISTSDPEPDQDALIRATQLATAHGIFRLGQEFTLGDVLSEFHALRHEMWSALWRITELDHSPLSLLKEMDARLNATFDAIARTTVDACLGRHATG